MCARMPLPDPAAVDANAYAIAYRLLGDRPAARAAVGIAVERLRATGGLERPDWLCQVASATVSESVGVAASGATATSAPSDDALRAALRRRLASASDDERVAASLHHLAGYPVEQVAAFMGRPTGEVERLTGALAPPPGISYRELGDPELVGAAAPAPTGRRLRVSASTLVTVLVIVGLVVGASRCVGPRPTLGPAPTDVPVEIGPDVAAEPSTGCALPPPTTGTFATTADSSPAPVAYRLAVPPPSAPTFASGTIGSGPSSTSTAPTAGTTAVPRALLVAVADTGVAAETFATTSGLESAALDAGYVVATVAPSAAGTTTAVDEVGAVLRAVQQTVCIDTARVTVTGLGSGGQTATAVACADARAVTVAAAVGGASMTADCELTPAVSLLMLWSADDQVLPPSGGYGPQVVPPSSVAAPLPPSPAGQVSEEWARQIGAPEPTRTTLADGAAEETAVAPSGATVRWVTAPSGGHSWSPAATTAVLAFSAEHGRTT